MIKQKTVSVNGEDFLITQLPATKGTRVLKVLVALIGPAFAEITKDGATDGVGRAMEKVFDQLDQVDVEGLLKALIETCSKGNMAINFDNEFAGEYDKLFKLCREVVEFNYGSVFTLLGSSVR